MEAKNCCCNITLEEIYVIVDKYHGGVFGTDSYGKSVNENVKSDLINKLSGTCTSFHNFGLACNMTKWFIGSRLAENANLLKKNK